MSVRKLLNSALVLALAVASLTAAAEEPMLRVDAIRGLLQVERGGQVYGLHEGEALQAHDVLSTDAQGHASLGFSRYGFLELGSHARVSLDALPESSFRGDLKTVFRLDKGYLRVVWKRPPAATDWPLYVAMGETRAALGSGEYFFQQGATEQRLCAAAGLLTVQLGTGNEGPEQVRPPACARVRGSALEIVVRDPDDWHLVRRAFNALAGEPVIAEFSPPSSPVLRKPLDAPVPLTSSADMPAAKPGFDYSLLEGQAGPDAATEPAPRQPLPLPSAQVPAALAPAAPSAATANANAYEVAATPSPAAAPGSLATIPDLAPAEVVRPQGVAAGRGSWRINVASSIEEAEAKALLAHVLSLGLPARQTRVQIHGRDWYRIQVGAYPTAAAAKADSGRVAATLGLGSVWFAQDK